MVVLGFASFALCERRAAINTLMQTIGVLTMYVNSKIERENDKSPPASLCSAGSCLVPQTTSGFADLGLLLFAVAFAVVFQAKLFRNPGEVLVDALGDLGVPIGKAHGVFSISDPIQ